MTLKPPDAVSLPLRSRAEVLFEAPLNVQYPEFGAMGDGSADETAALTAVNAAIGDSYGADVLFPPGEYRFESRPVISKNNVTWRGAGAKLVVDRVMVQADAFKATDLNFEARAGVGAPRAIFVDPAGAGRTLEDVTVADCRFDQFFYSVDCRGTAAYQVRDVKISRNVSHCMDGTNAAHFQNVRCYDVLIEGNSTYNGQEASSYNLFECGGHLRVIGNGDEDNPDAGVEIENPIDVVRAVVVGNVFGRTMTAADQSIWIDDCDSVIVQGNVCAGEILVSTTHGPVNRLLVHDNIAARIKLDEAGSSGVPEYIDRYDITDNMLVGHPTIQYSYAVHLGSGRCRKGRVRGNLMQRYRDGTTDLNFTGGGLLVARSADLDVDVADNDFDGLDVGVSGTGGSLAFRDSNLNFPSQSTLAVPVLSGALSWKAGVPSDADYDAGVLRNGLMRLDLTNNRVYFRTSTGTWKYAALT